DYRADRVDHAVLGTPEVISVCRHLTGLSVADRLTLGYVESGRADVIGAGALIVESILRRCATSSVIASEADILEGIAGSMSEIGA
ncbi:MAG: exopolyphosphatase, partial [Nocardioides sp.]